MSARQKMLITPVDGHTVPKPDGTPLNAAGEVLPVTPWWRRRARDGDVTISPRPARSKKKGS